MNWIRNALIGGILVVVFLLFIRWNDYNEAKIAAETPYQENVGEMQQDPDLPSEDTSPQNRVQGIDLDDDDLPTASDTNVDTTTQNTQKLSANTSLISVKTDTLNLLINPRGGDIVQLSLRKYLANINDKESAFSILNQSQSHTYIAQSALFGPNGTHTKENGRSLFKSLSSSYKMNEDDDELVVDLVLSQNQANITKRFTFYRDSHLIDIQYIVDNKSDSVWKAAMYGRIKRDDYKPPTDTGFGMKPFVGAAITTPETNYKKFDFDELDDLGKAGFKVEEKGGWVAMIQHYFVSAWVPDPDQTNNFTLQKSNDRIHYLLGYTGPTKTIAAGEKGVFKASFYAGPKIIKELEKISPHLDLTIDFSWLWFIAKPLFLALDFIHGFVNNWGIAIILLTCLVKLVFFYPSAMSYRSMAKMRKVMPQMQELKERYGDDRQKMGAETMKLYKKEGVNPVGGCLPMIMQMPVFIALYWALMESVELRHSPFFFWIQDLSVKDPFFVLPLIFGASMFFQQKLNPAPTDPMQAKVMQLMPIFFTFLFMMFPSGLVLYWVTNNALSITQQYIITKNIEKEG